ncbi:MAG: hypothetical protein VR71_08180 [Roseovarius sp. BRH_c41]|uniref:siderophore-interacting protein n=1 Tax=Roseovarius sp. BRH_c41 TaxID=1629709 RepID=UPI0005F23270|nr:siderophore-interacting protein [Roseovarius sp. BRH_c41]KJS43991.1 MAG: hypothetical protein VR71_08180 [Roseovarius sp. BRH_c41]
MTQIAQARLPMAGPQATRLFEDMARAVNLPAIRIGEGLRLPFGDSLITLVPQPDETLIDLRAETPAALQSLRDFLAEQAAQGAFSLAWDAATSGAHPANFALGRVCEMRRLSPSYRRLIVEGPDLGRFAAGGHHLRLLFGPEGAGWPRLDVQGVTQWPGGLTAWHRPVYTIRRIIHGTGQAARLEIDIFLHAGGRTTGWTERVTPGTILGLTGPGGAGAPSAGWLGLVGDETALPVIARILAEAPDGTRGSATLFVPERGDIRPLAHPAGLVVTWVLRGGQTGPLDALRALAPPPDDRHVFFAAERTEATEARLWLTSQGFDRSSFTAAGYWTKETIC